MNKYKELGTMVKKGDYSLSHGRPTIALEKYRDALKLLPKRSILSVMKDWSQLWQIYRQEKSQRKKLLKRIKMTKKEISKKDKIQNHHKQDKPFNMKKHEKEIDKKNKKNLVTKGFKSIRLENRGGLGAPGYLVCVHSNGSIEWEGLYFVTKEGKHRWHISDKKIDKLSEAIHKAAVHRSCIRYFRNVPPVKLDNRRDLHYYLFEPTMIYTDVGSIRLTVELIDSDNKTVVCKKFCPEKFSWLIDEIERLTGINEYFDGFGNKNKRKRKQQSDPELENKVQVLRKELQNMKS